MKNPFTYPSIRRLHGSGTEKKIAIIMRSSGIGDTVHVLPALSQKVADGYDVTFITDRARRFMVEPLGVWFIPRERCPYSWEERNRANYGTIYSLYAASLVPHYGSPDEYLGTDRAEWHGDFDGNFERGIDYYFTGRNDSRFQLFANAIETTLPETFSWEYLQQVNIIQNDILFAPWSLSNNRSAPRWLSIQRALQNEIYFDGNFTTIGTDPDFEQKFGISRAANLKELVSYVQGARLVIAVDAGMLALALALKKPCVMLAGPHDHQIVFEQFKKYHEVWGAVVYPPQPGGCEMPCNWEKRKGFGVNGRCLLYSDCMMLHTPETVVPVVKAAWEMVVNREPKGYFVQSF